MVIGTRLVGFLCHSETDKCQGNMLQTCEELAQTIHSRLASIDTATYIANYDTCGIVGT